ncbi:CRISPR-associated CARF protein Csx1 [Thermotoga profunda]|uniref:CRISPR-associated CARF protein Csx1 n=1 Tax=Thermotoga profunda TaxID=1508420 RepID=UPI0005973C13|nr:CRISPR-associated CARF protein Csx1 [Thermotoga profunda]
MNGLIYQVGRILGETKSFFIPSQESQDDFCQESELSSFFLKKYHLSTKKEETKVILIYPVSILLNKRLPEEFKKRNLHDLEREIKDIVENPDEYLKNPVSYIRKIPCENDKDDILVIHSLGTYEKVELKGDYDDIVLELFFDMVKRYLREQIQEFYLDISSGLNIYISAMIEAARYFSIFATLVNWPGENSPKITITFSDPIIGSTASKYEIHFQKQVYPTAFESPFLSYFKRTYQGTKLTEDELNRFLKTEIFRDNEKLIRPLKRSLSEKLLKSFWIYSAIINCVPLFLYYENKHTEQEIFQEIENLIEYAEKKLYSNYRKSPKLNKEAYVEIICQLGLYIGMIRMLQSKDIKPINRDTGVSLKRIESVFKEILTQIGFNHSLTFLLNEVDLMIIKTNRYLEKTENQVNGWFSMREVIDPGSKSTLSERNFFAHIGLARDITELRKGTDETIYVRYNEHTSLDEVREYLLRNI